MHIDTAGRRFLVGAVDDLGGPLFVLLGDLVIVFGSGNATEDIEHVRVVLSAHMIV